MASTRRINLKDLPVGFSWYTEIPDGSVSLARNIRKRVKEPDNLLSSHAVLSLALTQACCARGIGKVYFLASEMLPPRISDKSAIAFEVYSTSIAVPTFVYVPEQWTAETTAEWEGMTPKDQVTRCWAPHGWIHPQMSILPFTAMVPPDQKPMPHQPQFHGHIDAPVLLLIAPRLYLGRIADMRAQCSLVSTYNDCGQLVGCTYVAKSWTGFERWSCRGLDALVKSLEIYYHEDIGILQTYEAVVRQMQQAYKEVKPGIRELAAIRNIEESNRLQERERRLTHSRAVRAGTENKT